jgi:branched-chain amino acid transport system permease protein
VTREVTFRTALVVVAALALFAGLAALDVGWETLLPDGSLRQVVLLAACNVVVAVSLNVINGLAGQFSIGHAGFLALGAYTAAVVASHAHLALGGGDVTFARSFVVVPAAVASSAMVAGVAGVLVGLPSLRLRGDYLAVVTLGFAEIVRLVIATAQIGGAPESVGHAWVHGHPLRALGLAVAKLGGANGYAGPDEQGVPLYAGPFWIFGLALAVMVAAWRIKFSGWGRALRALREDEVAAASVGVDPTRYKVVSFVVSAVGGGVAGAMLATMRDGAPIVQPDSFGFGASFDAVTMVVLGGSGSVTGAALGALLMTAAMRAIELAQHALEGGPESLDLNALRMMVYAAVLVVLMARRPGGILGERELGARRREAARP